MLPVQAHNRHVLIVEDDEDIRQAVVDVLQHEGYTTQEARDGREALALLNLRPLPGCIVLDLLMPVMDGPTLVTEMTARPPLDTVPIVVLSASMPMAQARQRVKAAEWLEKPVTIDRLVEVVRRFCGPPHGGGGPIRGRAPATPPWGIGKLS